MSRVPDPSTHERVGDGFGGVNNDGVDFDLGGVVGLRLVDAGAREIAAVTRQLGSIRRPLAREPDVLVRFVERLALKGPLRFIGLSDAAFSDDEFLLLRGKHESRLRVQIPFDQVGASVARSCASAGSRPCPCWCRC